jgi:regulator of protease activity HflC (stomatin/prohibitin superfamily)
MSPNKPEIIGGKPTIKFKPNIKIPKSIAGVFILIAALIVVTFIVIQTCFTYIRPNELGIKQVNIGINGGIKEKIYEPGLVFRKPFGFELIHRFPNHVQVLNLTDRNAIKIQTSDGFHVDVDVSILYKIVDPYKLIDTLGPGESFLHEGIKPKAEPKMKEILGELTTEDFYNSFLRVEKSDMAQVLLNEEMSKFGMGVDQVLIRFFKYSDEIQHNIEQKKLQDQLVFKNISEGRAATEAAQLKKITEEGEANVKVTLAEGEAYKVEKDAERDLYIRVKQAEADLLVQIAEARRTELKNEAMQAVGADKAVALEMAKVLSGMEVLIVPTGGPGGLNPLDLDQFINLFGVDVTESSTGGGSFNE